MTKIDARDRALAFLPHVLRDYALLADGERGILAGPRGDFAWMCAPRWDSDAVFFTREISEAVVLAGLVRG